jgi:CxxC motif-containing protein
MVLRGGPIKRLPVISSAEIPKTMMSQCLDTLYRIKVNAPVKMGDIIVSDICGAGVDIVAARSVDKTDANKVDKEVIYG